MNKTTLLIARSKTERRVLHQKARSAIKRTLTELEFLTIYFESYRNALTECQKGERTYKKALRIERVIARSLARITKLKSGLDLAVKGAIEKTLDIPEFRATLRTWDIEFDDPLPHARTSPSSL